MSNVLVLCPSRRDYREMAALEDGDRHRFLFHDYASLALEQLVAEEPPSEVRIGDPEAEIERITSRYEACNVAAVVSTDDYPGTLLASIVSHRFGLPGVPVAANLVCQHKYWGREIQRNGVPECVPDFELWDPERPEISLPFPVFIKPIKSFLSVGAYRVDSNAELQALGRRATLPDPFFCPFDVLFERYAGRARDKGRVLVETLLEGCQATLEGYVYRGETHVIGIVDSIMFPNTISFQRFEYPSRLPGSAQERMEAVAKKVMYVIGFDNGLFNIEFSYNAADDTVHIIEINPRMSSQFADLFEKVDGTNSYSILLDIALARRPNLKMREGAHAMAASCVLRVFENKKVIKLPSADEIAALREQHPDMRIEILGAEGELLSRELQDGRSYRYGILNIGGRDAHDIRDILESAQREMTFGFERA